MDNIQYVGYVATFIQVTMYIPQISKLFKNKSSEGISLNTFVFNLLSAYLWLLYTSVMGTENIAAFIANVLTLLFVTPTTAMILKYSKRNWKPLVLFNILILITGAILFAFSNKINVSKYIKFILVIVAGTLSAITFIPQSYKTVKLKEIENLSISLTVMRFISASLWFIYWLWMYVTYDKYSYLISVIFTLLGLISVIPIIVVYTHERIIKKKVL